MADYAIPALCLIAAIGITGYIEFAVRVFREEGFDRG
jgi:hypothetical protein